MVLQSAMAGSVALGKLDLCSVHCIDSIGGDIQPCKLCSNSEYVSKMLLCDRCEEAFHVSCCKPRVALPVDDWFCHSCSELAREMSHNTYFLKSPSIGAGIGSCRFLLGPIAVMLKYPEPYTSKVRMGEAFQAQVPDWCHQISLTPLSEVQTDDLGCSSAVISNSTDSDSADPQMGSGTTGLASTSRKRKQEFLS